MKILRWYMCMYAHIHSHCVADIGIMQERNCFVASIPAVPANIDIQSTDVSSAQNLDIDLENVEIFCIAVQDPIYIIII